MAFTLFRPRGRHRYSTPEDRIEILKMEVEFLRRVASDRKALIRKLGEDLKQSQDREAAALRQLADQDLRVAALEEASFFNDDAPTLEIEMRRAHLAVVPEAVEIKVPEAGSASGLPGHMMGQARLHLVRFPS